MSDTERIEGIIKFIPRNENETDKEYFERVTKCNYQKYSYEPDSIQEAIYDNDLNKKFISVKNKIYEFIEREDKDPYDCYCNLSKIDEEKIKFSTSFYNGGTCLQEMLEEALEKFEG